MLGRFFVPSRADRGAPSASFERARIGSRLSIGPSPVIQIPTVDYDARSVAALFLSGVNSGKGTGCAGRHLTLRGDRGRSSSFSSGWFPQGLIRAVGGTDDSERFVAPASHREKVVAAEN